MLTAVVVVATYLSRYYIGFIFTTDKLVQT